MNFFRRRGFFAAAILALVAFVALPTFGPSGYTPQTFQHSATPQYSGASAPASASSTIAAKWSGVAQAASMTDYLENKLADHIFRTTTYSQPATIYVALLTAGCSDSSAGTEVSTSGTGYARVALNPGNANWKGTHGTTSGASSGTGGTISNASAITFGSPIANWTSVTHFKLSDASTAGNDLFCAALTTPKTVNNGDAAPSFAIDALTVQVDN